MNHAKRLTAQVLTESYETGKLDPTEFASEALRKTREISSLNAFRTLSEEEIEEAARRSSWRYERKNTIGLLDGVIVALKDSFDSIGSTTRHGSLTTSDEVSSFDSPAVAAMRRSGAILMGRTTMPEFGWKAVCDSPLTGVTANPWDPSRTPGGSSGGDAVAIASGCATLALGADIGGSVRIPAAFCGIVGFKPTHDRASRHPGSHAGVLSREGPMTHSVADAALMLDAIASVRKSDPPSYGGADTYRRSLQGSLENKRIAILTEHPEVDSDPRVLKAVQEACEVFRKMGAELYQIDAEELDLSGLRSSYELLLGKEMLGNVVDLSEREKDRLDPGLRDFAAELEKATMTDIVQASAERKKLLHRMWSFHQDYDLLVTPTVPILPFETEREVPKDWPHDRWTSWTPFTWPFNMTGQPALSVPCGLVDGLPVGLQIVGARRFDGLVLRAGYFFERALAFDETPPYLES